MMTSKALKTKPFADLAPAIELPVTEEGPATYLEILKKEAARSRVPSRAGQTKRNLPFDFDLGLLKQ